MSGEEAAFWAAVRANPDDETARLVFADWLADRGDPRAEYMRTPLAGACIRLGVVGSAMAEHFAKVFPPLALATESMMGQLSAAFAPLTQAIRQAVEQDTPT